MLSSSKHAGRIFPVKRRNILGAILLSVMLYALAGTGGFGAAKAGTDSYEAMPGTVEIPSQVTVTDNQTSDKTEHESSSQAASWKTILMRVTAYCSCRKCCGKFNDGITASGHRIRHGDKFVAAGKMLSFGTEIIIPGYNNSQPVKVLDRGRSIHGNRLDVYFDSHKKARKWAIKYLPVKVCRKQRKK
jgi:3D (Asp-Asp-Asp) domain-containing protein